MSVTARRSVWLAVGAAGGWLAVGSGLPLPGSPARAEAERLTGQKREELGRAEGGWRGLAGGSLMEPCLWGTGR